jgi:enoyl-CoA hydratase
MGWIAKSFPADELEEAVMRELRPLTSIAPDLLAAQKASINNSYEIMGMRTALQQSWMFHALSAHFRPGAMDFAKAAMDGGGIAAALAWQNGPFREEGFGP